MNMIETLKYGPALSIDRAGKSGRSTANKIKHMFPNVKTVHDALSAVRIDVGPKDRRGAKPQENSECALAKAVCRTFKADAAFIGIRTSYLIMGDKAIRFYTPETVSREIVSFDRHEDFATGIYRLSAVSPSQRLGKSEKRNGKKRSPIRNHGRLINHRTTRVRSEL